MDALSSAPTSPGKFKDAIGSGLLANPNQRLSHFPRNVWSSDEIIYYSRTSLKQYCWDRGFNIELERLLN
jgi:hypothetical protein